MKILGLEFIKSSELEELREVMTLQKRALEDIGWTRINQSDAPFSSLVKDSYVDMVKRSRLAYIKNPIIAHALHITTWYTFGEGVQMPKAQDKEVQDIVSEFWKDRDNRESLTAEKTQQQLSNKLQYDGELALIFTVDLDGTMYVRVMDPLSIVQVIRDPTDAARPLYYRRKINGQDEYIADWQNGAFIMAEDPRYSEVHKNILKALRIPEKEVKKNCVLYHVKTNCDVLDVRGIPEVYRALDWMNANSKINSDAASFIHAQAQFAWKMKFQGTKNQIQTMKSRMRQNTDLTNPSYQAGSMATFNDKIDLDPVGLPSSTGALFETGIRRTLLMTACAFGIMEHYFCDPSTGNLATAEAMELPMLKKFLSRQKFWESVYDDTLQFQLDMKRMVLNTKAYELNPIKNRVEIRKGRDYKNRKIDIDFPPILEQNIKALAEAMSTAKSKQLMPVETAQRIFMQGAGVNNIEEEMKKEFAEPQVPPSPFGGGPQPPNPLPPTKKPVKESVTGKTSSVQHTRVRVADASRELLRKVNAYIREIAGAYNALAKDSPKFLEVFKKANDKYGVRIDQKALDKHLESFVNDMHKLALKYYPKAVSLGESYVVSQVGIQESDRTKLMEQADDLTDDLVDRNEKFLRSSLKKGLKAGIAEVAIAEFDKEMEAINRVRKAMIANERRVGMYGAELWAVGQRAVKEVAKKDPDRKANFIGVEDENNCQGCQEAISGNPHPIARVPVPGEQDCMSNCRHAIQLEGDEELTEADVQMLRDAETESKKGYRLLEDSVIENAYSRREGTSS